jgi:histidyl-tRNA synthetase
MALKYEKPPGTEDLLPGEPDPSAPPEDRIWQTEKWQAVEALFRDVCQRFGFAEIRTPIFEETDLFVRSVGAGTDIVAKEMYTFEDRGGRSMTLRPEGTAPVVRAYLQHKLYGRAKVHKFFYLCPIFRYERQQRGRYRQHHQAGVEVIGAQNPTVDVEVLSLGLTYLAELGLTDTELHLNSVGCPRCRPAHRQALQAFLGSVLDQLCPDCHQRYQINPLRTLDCKEDRCQRATRDAPVMVHFLCPDCLHHFASVQEQLTALGWEFTLNPRLVRGLDYYTKTAFEILHGALGAQNVLLGGGRYDGLVEQCGGPPTPGIGFGAGIERILLALEQTGRTLPLPQRRPIFLAGVSDPERRQAQLFALQLRRAGMDAEIDYEGKSLKAQMRVAHRLHAVATVFFREEDLAQGFVALRQMDDGTQENIPLDRLIEHLTGPVHPSAP